MNDLSSPCGTDDGNVAKENGNVPDKESDVEKANGFENCTLNVYKRKIKENKFDQVEVEPEKVEERSDLVKQPSGGKKDQKQKTTKLEAKDTSDLGKQPSSSKKKQKQKTTELQVEDTSDSSKQPGCCKEVKIAREEDTETKAKTKLPEKKTHNNGVSNDQIDSKKEDRKKKLKETELTKDEDDNKKKKKKEKKLEADDLKRKRSVIESKEGNEQMESVSKKTREDNAMVDILKEKKVKSENESRKGHNQDGKKKKQKLVEPEDVGRKGHIQHGKKKQKVMDNGNNSENEKENGTTEINMYKFPMNRVMKIIKNEEFNGRISQEAIFVINKASEKFLELFAKEAYASAFMNHKTQVSYDHLSSVLCKRKRFGFLSDFVPEKVKAEDAFKEMSKDDDDHETTT